MKFVTGSLTDRSVYVGTSEQQWCGELVGRSLVRLWEGAASN